MKLSALSVAGFTFAASFSPYFSLCAFAKIEFSSPSPKIIEEMSSYHPGHSGNQSTIPEVVKPSKRSFAQFGGVTSELSKKQIRPWCGPSPQTNTMNCFDITHSGVYLQSFPIPGRLSTTPVFADNSWIISTSKGYLMRVDANPENHLLPNLTGENTFLWGTKSRQVMASYKPKPIYTDENNSADDLTRNSEPPYVPKGIKWIFPSSSRFIGTPVVKNGLIYAFGSNQYFQAFQWSTGKLVWAARLAPSSTLRLNSNAFTIADSEIYVGNSLGSVLALNPTTGSVLWSWQVSQADSNQRLKTGLAAGPDKFTGIVAAPLIYNNNIIVSNAESMTQAVSLESHELLWSYPLGSVAQAKAYKDNIILPASNGDIVSLNNDNGDVKWKTSISQSSPVVGLFLTKSNVLLATTRRGQVFLLNPENGKILSKNFPIGETTGEFFAGYGKSDACLNFVFSGFRCFRAKL